MNEKQRVLLDFRIEREALIAQAEKLRDSDNMDLDVSGDIHGKDQKEQKRLKEKAGRAAQVWHLRTSQRFLESLFEIELGRSPHVPPNVRVGDKPGGGPPHPYC